MIRLGIAYASAPVIQILNNVKAPYSISTPTALLASRALSLPGLALLQTKLNILKANHKTLKASLLAVPNIIQILGAGNANFLLARIGRDGQVDDKRAKAIYLRMAQEMGVVVRYRGGEVGCLGCLRITIGTEEECSIVLARLTELLKD